MQAGAMRSALLLLLCVTTLDQGQLDRCITEKSTSRQVACVQKSGASMGMALCFEAGE